MKIVFICGSLENGKDGVGDYTRRLAGELINNGHQVSIIAIHDKYILGESNNSQIIDSITIPSLRLSLKLPLSKRVTLVNNWITKFKPDWISLQYVPFSFNNRGLLFTWNKKIAKIGTNYRWHIMFHELWVGAYGNSTLKHKVLGHIQKFSIFNLINTLKPLSITTSLPIYKTKIGRETVHILPLFSNIPYINNNTGVVKLFHENTLIAVNFGTFSGMLTEFMDQIKFLREIALSQKRELKLLIIGEGGPFKYEAIKIAKDIIGDFNVIDKGKLTSDEISKYLSIADIGISRSDLIMVGKSGSTLAMLEHGLPVLLRGSNNNVKDYKEFLFKDRLLSINNNITNLPIKNPPISLLKEVGLNFIDILIKASK